jgi:hypothetical protein
MAQAPPLTVRPFQAVFGSYRMRHLHASASSQETGHEQTRFTCILTEPTNPHASPTRVTIVDSERASARACPRHAVAVLECIASARVDWPDSKGLNEGECTALELAGNEANLDSEDRAYH